MDHKDIHLIIDETKCSVLDVQNLLQRQVMIMRS